MALCTVEKSRLFVLYFYGQAQGLQATRIDLSAKFGREKPGIEFKSLVYCALLL